MISDFPTFPLWLPDWSIGTGRCPQMRIGVVLPEDRQTSVVLEIHGGGKMQYTAKEGGVQCRYGDQDVGGVGSHGFGGYSYCDMTDPPLLRLHDVRVGRGFHWEKRVVLSLPGSLEITQFNSNLLVVNTLSLEDYLVGVITSEMSGECPLALLQAQCVAARSWVLARSEKKHEIWGIDYCNDDCCQRYQGTAGFSEQALEAVKSTIGEVLCDEEGQVVDANYSKNCGGVSEDGSEIWGRAKAGQSAVVDALPGSMAHQYFPVTDDNLHDFISGDWLREGDVYCGPGCVPDADLPRYLGRVDDGQGYFRWSVAYGHDELAQLLNQALHIQTVPLPGFFKPANISRLLNLRVTRRGKSGRATELAIDYLDETGAKHTHTIQDQYAIRSALHERFLYSSALEVNSTHQPDGRLERVCLNGAGWGHGAGLCQIGALGRALAGQDYRTILAHYFQGTSLKQVYANESKHA